jgi:hypothetical protein
MRPFVLFLVLVVFVPFLVWGQFAVVSSNNANSQINTTFSSGDSAGNYVGFTTTSSSSVGSMLLVKAIPLSILPDSVRFFHRTPLWSTEPVRIAVAVDSSNNKLIASGFIYASTKEDRTTVPFMSRSLGANQVNNLYIAVSAMNSDPQTLAVIFRGVELFIGGSWMRYDSVGVTGVAAISAPALQFPANNSTKVNLSTTFIWFPVVGATDYKTTIWIEGYPSAVVLYSATSQTSPFSLPPNKIVQWQVVGRVNGVDGPPSPLWTFQTGSTLTGIQDGIVSPDVFGLAQNYPNPFNPTTTINFHLERAGYTELKVYDFLGREIKTLVAGELSAGTHETRFQGTSLASGIYFYRLASGGQTQIRQMVLQK